MLDSSENSHQGQRLEKLKALCFERGCWLIFDNELCWWQVLMATSQSISQWRLRALWVPSNRTPLLSPKPLLCHWSVLATAVTLPAFLNPPSHTPPLTSFIILISWSSSHSHAYALSAPSLSHPDPKNGSFDWEGRGFNAKERPVP